MRLARALTKLSFRNEIEGRALTRNVEKRVDMSQEVEAAAGAPKEDPIDQVRELLFGATKRQTDDTIRTVEQRLEHRLDEIRSDMLERISVLESRLVELSRDTENNRAASVEAIGSAISQLGATIQSMAAGRKR